MTIDLNALKDELLSQQQMVQQSQSTLNRRGSEASAVAEKLSSNRKLLNAVGLSCPPINSHLGGRNVFYNLAFSFLDVNDLQSACRVSKIWKEIISENNHMERALIVRISCTNPIRAAELRNASPALQRLEVLAERQKAATKRLERVEDDCVSLQNTVKGEAMVLSVVASAVLFPSSALPSLPAASLGEEVNGETVKNLIVALIEGDTQ